MATPQNPIDQNTPGWLQSVITFNQARQNIQDASALAAWLSVAQRWVDAGHTGQNPGNVPTLTTFYDAGDYMDQASVPNPAAIMPTPTPKIPVAPITLLSSGAFDYDAQVLGLLHTIIQLLTQPK